MNGKSSSEEQCERINRQQLGKCTISSLSMLHNNNNNNNNLCPFKHTHRHRVTRKIDYFSAMHFFLFIVSLPWTRIIWLDEDIKRIMMNECMWEFNICELHACVPFLSTLALSFKYGRNFYVFLFQTIYYPMVRWRKVVQWGVELKTSSFMSHHKTTKSILIDLIWSSCWAMHLNKYFDKTLRVRRLTGIKFNICMFSLHLTLRENSLLTPHCWRS